MCTWYFAKIMKCNILVWYRVYYFAFRFTGGCPRKLSWRLQLVLPDKILDRRATKTKIEFNRSDAFLQLIFFQNSVRKTNGHKFYLFSAVRPLLLSLKELRMHLRFRIVCVFMVLCKAGILVALLLIGIWLLRPKILLKVYVMTK